MEASGILAEYPSRIDALKNKYFIVNARIDEASKRPSTNDYYITQLKKQRLILKEEIEGIRKAS